LVAGHPEADVSFFSFGTIKVATVFGGAVLKIKDRYFTTEYYVPFFMQKFHNVYILNFACRELYQKMNHWQRSYPVQTKHEYAAKLAKYAVITTFFNSPIVVK